MKEERGGPGETYSTTLAPRVIAAPAEVAKWRPRELPVESMKDDSRREWNTRALEWRVGADLASAASAGVLVAPIISIIDR